MKAPPTRKLHFPPPGKPNISLGNRSRFDLLYLSWGKREYGEAPVPISLHDGWTYLVVMSGSPRLIGMNREVPLKGGDLLVLGPNFAYGMSDEIEADCEIITWIWKNPPAPHFQMTDNAVKRVGVSPQLVSRLNLLHRHCRDESQCPDGFSAEILRGLRAELDGIWGRALTRKSSTETGRWRLHLAVEWLQKQIGVSDPVRSVCDYLQVSPSTLKRLFHKHLGAGPREFIHQARMEYALKLRPYYRLKEIAHLLGYKHANDLSRALAIYTGRRRARDDGPPSQKQTLSMDGERVR